jgi:beta-lactamase class A
MSRLRMRASAALIVLAFIAPPPIRGQEPHRDILRAKLARELTRIADDFDGVLGAQVLDLTDSSTVGVNEQLLFPQGSAIKVPILLELFRQAESRPALLGARTTITASARTPGGVLAQFLDGGSAIANEDLATLMIVLSDNTAANILIDLVGMDSVNRTLERLGFHRTRLRRKMIRPAASARGEENLSTPAEAALLMARLARCELPVSRTSCERMRRILEIPKEEAVRSVIPDSIPVASKPGEIEGVSTTWALVNLPDRPFVLTVMTNYADGTDAVIRDVARVVYDHFSRLARSTPYGARVPLTIQQEERKRKP